MAFSTLLERKLLGLSQSRMGPNKVAIFGILQPVRDGVKLLIKTNILLTVSNFFLILSPVLLLGLFLSLWGVIIPWWGRLAGLKLSSLILFVFLGVRGYAVILTGWGRFSSFSKLGSLRGILQRLSFEAVLIVRLLLILSLIKEFRVLNHKIVSPELVFVWFILWGSVCLIERNRAPFDLLEGESELIRGFNIELSRLMFVLLFLREYGVIVRLRLISTLLARGSLLAGVLLASVLLFVRCCFPRIRYDVIISII